MTLILACIENTTDDMDMSFSSAYCIADSLVSRNMSKVYTKRLKIILHSVSYKVPRYALGHLSHFSKFSCNNVCTAYAGNDLVGGNVSLHFNELLDNLYEVTRDNGNKLVVYKNDSDVPQNYQNGEEPIIQDTTPRLGLETLADFLKDILQELTDDYVEQNIHPWTSAGEMSCEAVILGKCMVTGEFQCFKIIPEVVNVDGVQRVIVSKNIIRPNNIVILGSHNFHDGINQNLTTLREAGLSLKDSCRQVVDEAIKNKEMHGVGGSIIEASTNIGHGDDFTFN